jgi:hypothetical protein
MPTAVNIDDSIAEMALDIRSADQARALLGECARLLRQGYDRLDEIPSSFWDSANARASAQSLLDQANSYAQKIYATIPASGGFAVDATIRSQVAAAMKSTWRALRMVEVSAEETYWDFMGSMRTVFGGAGSSIGTAISAPLAAALKGGLGKLWWVIALIVGAALFFWWVKR